MWQEFKKWYHKECLRKWDKEAIHQLFRSRDSFSVIRQGLQDTINWMEDLVKELNSDMGKDVEAAIYDRWQAVKFNKTLDQYRTALMKLDELLVNTPERPPEPEQYDIEYYH